MYQLKMNYLHIFLNHMSEGGNVTPFLKLTRRDELFGIERG